MSLNTFGVTAASLRSTQFPHWGDFSTLSQLTSADVGTIIDEEAADLAGRLYAENVVAADITTPANQVAYLWCAKTLRLMAAVRVLRTAAQADPELAKAYRVELDARLELLAAQGATALGDDSLSTGTSDPDGPTSHISRYSLETDSADDMSDTIPALRKDDKL